MHADVLGEVKTPRMISPGLYFARRAHCFPLIRLLIARKWLREEKRVFSVRKGVAVIGNNRRCWLKAMETPLDNAHLGID